MADPVHPLSNENNQGPAITVAAAFCMSISLLALGVRLWIRSPMSALLSYDDWSTAAATAIATIQSILTMIAVRDGLGQRLDNQSSQSLHVQGMNYAVSLLYVLSLCLGKLAVVLVVHRICASIQHQRTVVALAVAVVLWGVGSLFAIAAPFEPRNNEYDSPGRWIAVETIGLCLELLIFIFMVCLIWTLHVSHETKTTVLVGFCSRFGLFAIATVRLHSLSSAAHNTSASVTFVATIPAILTQVEMHYNVISATIICLRIFLRHFTSGYLAGFRPDLLGTSYSRQDTRNTSIGWEPGTANGKMLNHNRQALVRTSVELQTVRTGRNLSPTASGQRESRSRDRGSDLSIEPLYSSAPMTMRT